MFAPELNWIRPILHALFSRVSNISHAKTARKLAPGGLLENILDMPKPLLAFVDDVYEDLELWYPKLRVEEAGFSTRLAGSELKTFTGKHGYPAQADALIRDVN